MVAQEPRARVDYNPAPIMTDSATPQPTTPFPKRATTMRRNWVWAGIAMVVLIVAGLCWGAQLRRDRLQFRLLATAADAVIQDRQLIGFALRQARPLYQTHCAVCHGAEMSGNSVLGAPNLRDGVWLYGSGTVFDIERTLLYGIRSGPQQSAQHFRNAGVWIGWHLKSAADPRRGPIRPAAQSSSAPHGCGGRGAHGVLRRGELSGLPR